MLYPRIIPCLLVHKKGLVKTVKFKDPKYVGDPINTVKIFNEKEVDELMVFDIDATVENREPDYEMIENLAIECRMPLCYGGGIKTLEHAQRIFKLGVEKIAISSAIIQNPMLVNEISAKVGSQSIVIVLDVKRTFLGEYEIFINNGTIKVNMKLLQFVQEIQTLDIGEIVINSIDNDGMMNGYNFDLIDKIVPLLKIPVTIIGGAESLDNIGKLVRKYRIIGASAGSLFVFKGKYKAVLINYPNRQEKANLIKHNMR